MKSIYTKSSRAGVTRRRNRRNRLRKYVDVLFTRRRVAMDSSHAPARKKSRAAAPPPSHTCVAVCWRPRPGWRNQQTRQVKRVQNGLAHARLKYGSILSAVIKGTTL